MHGRAILGGIVGALLICAGFAGTATAVTYTCPTSQTISTGSVVSGSNADLCIEDGAKEVLKEGLSNGISKLRKMWTIPNVPAGTQYINFWGTRPTNSEYDDFQFYYNTSGQPFGILIPGAIVNKPFAPSGGLSISLGLTTSQPSTIYLLLADTDNSGPILDTVTFDTVRIETH